MASRGGKKGKRMRENRLGLFFWAVTSLGGWLFQSKNIFNAQIYSKNARPKTPHRVSGGFCLSIFSLFSHPLLFSALVLLFCFCVSYLLKLESCPPSEVTGVFSYLQHTTKWGV